MNWAEFAAADTAGPVGQALPLLADGTHVGEIVEVSIAEKPWCKAEIVNERGKSLVIVVSVRGHRDVEVTIPCHWGGKVDAVCRAARVQPPAAAEWDEQQLVGKVVSIDTLQATSGKGTEYVRIEKWLPGPAPLPAAAAPAPKPTRPPAKKADAAAKAAAPDDIPF